MTEDIVNLGRNPYTKEETQIEFNQSQGDDGPPVPLVMMQGLDVIWLGEAQLLELRAEINERYPL